MDFIKQQFEKLQEQIASLNASQKMLTATLAGIMIVTVILWGRYAGQAEMEPVLNQPFAAEEITRVTSKLASRGIRYRVEGDRILVPSSRKFEALAELSYSQLLPSDTRTGFDEIVAQMSPWDPHSRQQAMWNKAKEMTLSQVIRNWPDVLHADVIIDPTSQRRVGSSLNPRATVNITMRSGRSPSRRLIEAAADTVAGAQAGLDRGEVRVVVDGVSHPVQGDELGLAMGGGLIELLQQHERYHAGKINEVLAEIEGVLVSVTVDLETSTTQSQRREVDPERLIHLPSEEMIRTDESTMTHRGGMEAGAAPNVGMQIGEAGGSDRSDAMTEEMQTRFHLQYSEEVVTRQIPAGTGRVTAASVRIPRSYFVRIHQLRNPDAEDPDDAVLQPLIDAELPRLRSNVQAAVGLWSDEAVVVETYTDVMPAMAAAQPAETTSLPMGMENYGKEIALGALAILSLFMMSMIVRKGGSGAPSPGAGAGSVSRPGPEAASRGTLESRSLPKVMTAEDLAGEAQGGSSTLDGVELDEEAVRTQQMLDQVSLMVKENPDGAANLVKRWMNR